MTRPIDGVYDDVLEIPAAAWFDVLEGAPRDQVEYFLWSVQSNVDREWPGQTMDSKWYRQLKAVVLLHEIFDGHWLRVYSKDDWAPDVIETRPRWRDARRIQLFHGNKWRWYVGHESPTGLRMPWDWRRTRAPLSFHQLAETLEVPYGDALYGLFVLYLAMGTYAGKDVLARMEQLFDFTAFYAPWYERGAAPVLLVQRHGATDRRLTYNHAWQRWAVLPMAKAIQAVEQGIGVDWPPEALQ